MTNAPDNRVPVEKPAQYDERDFELLLRYVESGRYHPPESKWDPLPNAKTDTNNHGAVSTDFIGMNYDYPEGDYATPRAHHPQSRDLSRAATCGPCRITPRVPEKLQAILPAMGLAEG